MKNYWAHQSFLETLPKESPKRVFLKIVLVGTLGFLLSIVTIVFTFISIQDIVIKGTNKEYFFAIVSQNLPVFLLVLTLFYRGKIKKTFSRLFSKIANKSIRMMFGVLLLNLILGVGFNLIGFTFLRTPEKWNWLESYIRSGQESIKFEYLQLLFGSFIIFLLVAFFEEFVFRFTIYRFLRRTGLLLALLVSSFLFVIIHGAFNISVFLFGIMIALYYEYTNYFVGTVLIHALNNLFVVFYSYYLTYLILR